MIHIDNATLTFGEKPLFDHITCTFMPHQKIGLVGRNGAGKTTFLNVLARRQQLDGGTINIPSDFRIAFMPQEVVLASTRAILDEALYAFPALAAAHEERLQIEPLLNDNNLSATEHTDLIDRYAHAQQILQEQQYEQTIVKIKTVLQGLGFKPAQFNAPTNSLSVGWKMRLVLAQLLLQHADFYLFDEPTNHLDLQAKDWFITFLKEASFGYLLVSHDQYFLDTACDSIAALSQGKLRMYKGNYSNYLVLAEQERELQEKKVIEQQKYIKKQTATIERFRASATKAAMAQSMIKALEKIELITVDATTKNIRLTMPPAPHAGKIILDVKNLRFAFADKLIFDKVTFQILRGQRVAIVAPNGTGKTTLLDVIMGKLKPSNGEIALGHQVQPAFFEQDQNRSLNTRNTILDEVESACKTSEARANVRALLGSFLFSGDDVFKPIAVLSGGEKNRVAMVKILLQNANFLILDEPTNHLDIQSKEILLHALQQFQGTILFVSHDHYFLNNLATHILALTEQGATLYAGNYDAYRYHRQQIELQTAPPATKKERVEQPTVKVAKNNKTVYESRKLIGSLESKIERLEKELHAHAELLSSYEYHSKEYQKAAEQIAAIEKQLQEHWQTWEQLINTHHS